MSPKKVLISGGGIAGLCTAIALLKQGHEVKVFEQAPKIAAVGAGIALAVNAMKVMRVLGLEEEIIAKGNIPKVLQVCNHKGKVLASTNIARLKEVYHAENVLIHRADLHEILCSHLPEGVVVFGKTCRAFEETGKEVHLFFEDATVEIGEILIAADGIHSSIRQQLLPDSQPRYAGYTCWRAVADVQDVEVEVARFTETWGPKGRVGIVPLSDSRVYTFICMNAPENSAEMAAYTPLDLWNTFQSYHFPIPEVLKAIPEDGLLWNDMVDLKPLKEFAFGRVLLIGDAAHATTPNMGQGACMAIEDALVLAQCFAKNEDLAEAFTAFGQKRIPRTTMIINNSWQLGKMAQWTNPMMCSIRNMAMSLIPATINERQLKHLFQIDFA